MGAMTLNLEGWRKSGDNDRPTPIEKIQFQITEECHVLLEETEQELQESSEKEKMLDVGMESLAVVTSPDCGPLSDCKLRVYLLQRGAGGSPGLTTLDAVRID